MLKSLLVPVDGSEHSNAATSFAAALAGRKGSRVTLLYVIDVVSLEGPFLADLSGSIGVAPFLDLQKQVRAAMEEKAAVILETHAAALEQAGLKCATRIETGIVSRAICQEAVEHDAVVIGRRGEHASWRGFLLGSVVEEVIRGCARPVFVTPKEVRPLQKVLVAYDGSRTAGRALSVAVSLAEEMDLNVGVISVSGDSRDGHGLLGEAEAFLEPHGLAIEKFHETGSPAEAILNTAERAGYDAIIMGAYGHSRVRELLLGSTTDAILRKAKLPVLLYR